MLVRVGVGILTVGSRRSSPPNITGPAEGWQASVSLGLETTGCERSDMAGGANNRFTPGRGS